MSNFKTLRSLGIMFATDIIDKSQRQQDTTENSNYIILLEMIEISPRNLKFYVHIDVGQYKELMVLEDIVCKYECNDDFTKKLYYSVIFKRVKDLLQATKLQDILEGKIDFSNVTDFVEATDKQKNEAYKMYQEAVKNGEINP